MRETTELHNRMVCMERGYIPRASVNTAEERGRRRLGTQTFNCKKSPCAVPKQNARTTDATGDFYGGMTAKMGVNRPEPNPAFSR